MNAGCALRAAQAGGVTPVEHPLFDFPGAQQARGCEYAQVLTRGRLADAELLGDAQATDPVAHQVAVDLRRKVPPRILQPLQDLHPLAAGESLRDPYVHALELFTMGIS